jgi:protein-cysteine N-palmitoyltransferase HHAT
MMLRYMYVPLGGKTTQIWNVWPIFLFVAIWHDIEPKLLAWGGLNSLFYILEVLPDLSSDPPE